MPLPESVGFFMAEHLRDYPVDESGLMFTTAKGEPVRRQRLADAWRKAAATAGLGTVGFHAARHFYASLQIASGCAVKVVQARLGHASAVETLDVYGHLWPDTEDETRGAVDEVLGNLAERSRNSAS